MAIKTITIPAGETVSDAISVDFGGQIYLNLQTETITTADITFQGLGQDGVTYKNIYGIDGNLVTYGSVVSDGIYKLDPSVFVGIVKMRAVSSIPQVEDTNLFITYESL